MATLILWQDPDTAALGVIRLDAVTSESPEDTVAITEHPVEQGANVVDHARVEPTRLSIEGVVSTIPNPNVDTDAGFQVIAISVPGRRQLKAQTKTLQPPQPPITPSLGGLVSAGIGALLGTSIKAQFTGDTEPNKTTTQIRGYKQTAARNRVRDVYDALLRAQAARAFVTVSTRDRDYFDMMIERVAKPRSVDNGSSAQFQIDFKRVRVASSKTVASPKPAEARGKTSTNKGSQAAKKKTDEKPFKSVAAALADAGIDPIHLGAGG
jgi:hypothetical protein